MILDEIVASKRQELAEQQRAVPLAELERRAQNQLPPLDFAAALREEGVCLIAEVKRVSPSKGVLCLDIDPERLATTYASSGAAAISVLTEKRFFQGSIEYIARIKSAIGELYPAIPLLRKDFILEPYQVVEARACGADAVLLIVAILSDKILAELLALTHDLGMTALVEVHNEMEMARALRVCPRVVGINNRDLVDFSVDLATFGRLRSLLTEEVVTVAESGVHTAADVRELADMGADAILVGEALVTAPGVAEKVRELVEAGGGRQ